MIAVSEISNGGARDDAASSLHERHNYMYFRNIVVVPLHALHSNVRLS